MQVNYKEWYLLEIYSRLVHPIGADRAANAIIELREHLDETESEFIDRGLDAGLAQRAAMDRIGSPSKVAKSFVAATSYGKLLGWSLATAIAMIALSSSTFGGPTNFTVYFSAMAVAAVFGGLLTRKSLLPGVLVAGVLASVLVSAWSGSNTISVANVPPANYDTAHKRYFALKHEHENFLSQESKAADGWRKAMSELRANPNLRQIRVHEVHYAQTPIKYYSHGTPYDVGARDLRNSFDYKPIVESSPIAGSKLKAHVWAELDNVRYYQAERRSVLSNYERELNTSRLERISAHWVGWLTSATFFSALAWLMSLLSARVTATSLTRRRQIIS